MDSTQTEGPAAAIVDGMTITKANPRQEVVIGGPTAAIRGFGRGGILLSRKIDEVVRQFGRRVYELMLYDSAVNCAFELFKAGVLSDGLQFSPGLKMEPGEIISKRKRKAELKLAGEICDAATRMTAALEDPIEVTCDEMLSAFAFGCSLTEQTYAWGTGQDKGIQVLASLVVKPEWAWNFRVDQFMKVQAIRGWTGMGWQDFGPEKFAVLTWKKRNRDPRGQSGFRPAYNPWNLKIQQYPEFGEFLHHFADPTIYLTAGQDARDVYITDPTTGKRVSQSVIDQLLAALESYKHRTGLALPYGSSAGVLSPGTEGGAYHLGFDRFDLEIFRSILFSARPLQEAKHGSKADSDSGADLVAMAFVQGRLPLLACLRNQVYHRWVQLNWGADVAARLTPMLSLGSPGHIQAELMNAYANAYAKGFVDEAQLPVIWDRLGLPPVDQSAMQARSDRQIRREALAAQAKANQGKSSKSQGQDDGNDNGDGSGDGQDGQGDGNGDSGD